MKTLIFSKEASHFLGRHFINPRELDCLIEELHDPFVFLSLTTVKKRSVLFAVKVDSLQLIFDLQIDPTTILVSEIRCTNKCN